MTFTHTEILNIDGVDFDATFWFDIVDNTFDIEATAYVQSQYLAYPASSLVEIVVNVYFVPVSEWDIDFTNAARAAIAAA